jgi:hypothetical protein
LPTEIEEALAVLLGGRAAQVGVGAVKKARAEQLAFQALSRRSQAQVLASGAGRAGRFVGRQAITKNPWGIAAVLAYEGYIHRDEIAEVAENILGVARQAAAGERQRMGPPGLESLSFDPRPKRKVSKANRAVKYGMGLLKAGSKRATGADKGKLVKGAFKMATKAAGLANPLTPSNIGKGKGKIKALARKIRSWW